MTILAADLTHAVAEMLHDAFGDSLDDCTFASLVDETVDRMLAGTAPEAA